MFSISIEGAGPDNYGALSVDSNQSFRGFGVSKIC